ncbi:Non-canonical purine NTP pyrophosphatase [compost metagenome]
MLEGSPVELVMPPHAIEVDETGETFRENARLKARTYARLLGEPALADDSGLSVEALGGRPGVHSARYAGVNATDADRIRKLLGELEGVPDAARGACFHCALVLAWPGDGELTVEGMVSGRILHEARGEHGFGYDPVFYVPSLDKTFAELSPEEKNLHSHRAKAAELLVEALQHATAGR